MVKKETVGKQAWDAVKGSDFLDHSPEEQMREQLEDYESNVFKAVDAAKKIYNHDFYIVVETKKEPKLNNVIRNYFIHRSTCPTPTYDNVVYKYHRSEERLEFLWVLPSRDTYNMVKERALELPEDEKALLKFVLDDADGTLLNRCRVLNGEIN